MCFQNNIALVTQLIDMHLTVRESGYYYSLLLTKRLGEHVERIKANKNIILIFQKQMCVQECAGDVWVEQSVH